MANLPEINLADLHEAIGQAIADAFPSATVAAYGRPGEKLTVPAITFELDSIEPDEPADVGSEQLQVRLRFTAYCIHSYKQGNKLAVRVLAANLARFLRGKRWGKPVSAAEFVASVPDTFDAENPEYEVWRVEWEHSALLGVSVWDTSGEPPERVFVSTVPFIGIPNEPLYVEVTSPPEVTE
jgi:hypothetical protein